MSKSFVSIEQLAKIRGLDDIALTLTHGDAIDTFEQRRPAWHR